MKSECRFFKKDKQSGNTKPDRLNPTKKNEDKTTTIVEDQSEELYLVGECNLSSDDSSWIVNSESSMMPAGQSLWQWQMEANQREFDHGSRKKRRLIIRDSSQALQGRSKCRK
uniref:Uncharacterized protein n=1 Tax=Brassica oleracea var. oleracea TaxID=109376 RepID=A0A0D3C1K4_BRAOL